MLPRPRFTLSVRSLMILVLIIGGVLGWKVLHAAVQRRAVTEISRVGGMVVYEHQIGPDHQLQIEIGPGAVRLKPHPWIPDWLQSAVGEEYFHEVVWVQLLDLSGWYGGLKPPPTDEALAAIATLDRVRAVYTWGRVNDAGLAHFVKMPGLRSLGVGVGAMTESGLASLAAMPALEELFVDGGWGPLNRATLAGMSRLRRLKRLSVHLSVHLQDVTDPAAAVIVLGDMSWLESLDVSSSSKDAADLSHVRELTRLRTLAFPKSIPIDSDLANVSGLTRLEQLDLDYSKITDAELVHLSGLTRLQATPNAQVPLNRCRHDSFVAVGQPHESVADDLPSHRHGRCPPPKTHEAHVSGHPRVVLDRCRHGAPRWNESGKDLGAGYVVPTLGRPDGQPRWHEPARIVAHCRAGH